MVTGGCSVDAVLVALLFILFLSASSAAILSRISRSEADTGRSILRFHFTMIGLFSPPFAPITRPTGAFQIVVFYYWIASGEAPSQ
jgi:hypothetical protein